MLMIKFDLMEISEFGLVVSGDVVTFYRKTVRLAEAFGEIQFCCLPLLLFYRKSMTAFTYFKCSRVSWEFLFNYFHGFTGYF